MRTYIPCLLLLFTSTFLLGQVIPEDRMVDWSLAGLRDTSTKHFETVYMHQVGAAGDGVTPNDEVMKQVLASIAKDGAVLFFPEGNYVFHESVQLPSNVIIRGEGADRTIFTMDLGGSGHGFDIRGGSNWADTTQVTAPALREDTLLQIANADFFRAGDWVRLIQNDSDLVTSDWADHTVGQIIQIKRVIGSVISLGSPLRLDIEMHRQPVLQKIDPVEQVGIECIRIERKDNTAPQHSSNIHFRYAVNCWVRGVESNQCTFSHVEGKYSSNLHIFGSYFHHGFEYGGGGRAYGVMLHFTTNECLVENNVFEHLRHSMIVQAGANGNVFAYNYSLEPFWESGNGIPTNAAGDLVLHGNYVFSNLFEENIVQNIVIDNSHGPNGPFNTFFRNRGELFGLFFSSDNSSGQNLVGNEVSNIEMPYAILNYTIQGDDHFIYGNNNKGSIDPPGTSALPEMSCYLQEAPEFVPDDQFGGIGPPKSLGEVSIPARDRYLKGAIMEGVCNTPPTVSVSQPADPMAMACFPNPFNNQLTLQFPEEPRAVSIADILGRPVYVTGKSRDIYRINTTLWPDGVYFVTASGLGIRVLCLKVVKK